MTANIKIMSLSSEYHVLCTMKQRSIMRLVSVIPRCSMVLKHVCHKGSCQTFPFTNATVLLLTDTLTFGPPGLQASI